MPKVLLAFIIGFVISQIGVICTTVFLHRALAHKSITLAGPTRFCFRLVTWISTGIRPRQWVAVHRRHHAYTDVEGDPHSPLLLGFWKVQLQNAALYRRAARDGETVQKYSRDLPPDSFDRTLFDHGYLGLGIGLAILCLVFGWQVGLMAGGFHVVIYLSVNAAVNAVGHRFGKKVYDNTARNSQWLAWLTAGEGLHNNHHAAPTSARLALGPGEIDPGWWFITALVKMNQATIRLSDLKLAASRPQSPGGRPPDRALDDEEASVGAR